MTAIPTGESRIETPRLILRQYTARDFEALHGMTSSPEMFRYSERGPMSREESWARLLRHAGHWALEGYGVFAIEEKETGRFVGESGICHFRRRVDPAFDDCPEITWSIIPAAQGQGYATEAARAALRWADDLRSIKRTVCLIHAGNRVSLRVAGKLAYRPFRECVYRDYPAILLERFRP